MKCLPSAMLCALAQRAITYRCASRRKEASWGARALVRRTSQSIVAVQQMVIAFWLYHCESNPLQCTYLAACKLGSASPTLLVGREALRAPAYQRCLHLSEAPVERLPRRADIVFASPACDLFAESGAAARLVSACN